MHVVSQLDRLLLGGWEEAMKEGVFRYDLSEVACRTIPGQYGVVVMVRIGVSHVYACLCVCVCVEQS